MSPPPASSLIFSTTDNTSQTTSSSIDSRSSLPYHTPYGIAVATPCDTSFTPIPSTPAKCKHLKLAVLLDSTVYTAGGTLHGRLELSTKNNHPLLLREISVELTGYESVQNVNQFFLSAKIVFQGRNKRPSNAVFGSAVDNDGYYNAKRNTKTVFPFSFRIPPDAPSSYTFHPASLNYVVTGIVQFDHKGRRDVMYKSSNANVVESWKDAPLPPSIPIKSSGSVAFGGKGVVELEGVLLNSLYLNGTQVHINIFVRNSTKKRISGIKIHLWKKLIIAKGGGYNNNQSINQSHNGGSEDDFFKVIPKLAAETKFTNNCGFDPGEERSMLLNILIPPGLKSIRNTSLAEVAIWVRVTLNTGLWSKDVSIEVPIIVCDSASVTPPHIDTNNNRHPLAFDVLNEVADVSAIANEYNNKKENNRYGQHSTKKEKKIGRGLPWEGDSVIIQPPVNTAPRNNNNLHQEQQQRITDDDDDDDDEFYHNYNGDRHNTNNNRQPEIQQVIEPTNYVPAKERSKVLKKAISTHTLNSGIGELSFMPQDMYSFTENSALDFSIGSLPNKPPQIFSPLSISSQDNNSFVNVKEYQESSDNKKQKDNNERRQGKKNERSIDNSRKLDIPINFIADECHSKTNPIMVDIKDGDYNNKKNIINLFDEKATLSTPTSKLLKSKKHHSMVPIINTTTKNNNTLLNDEGFSDNLQQPRRSLQQDMMIRNDDNNGNGHNDGKRKSIVTGPRRKASLKRSSVDLHYHSKNLLDLQKTSSNNHRFSIFSGWSKKK